MGSDRRDRPGLPGRSSFLASAFEGSRDGTQDTQTDCRICYGRSVGAYCSFRNEITGDCKPRPAMHRTLEFLLHHGYVVLLGWVFVEQVGLPLPSMPLLLAAGALAGTGHLSFFASLFYVILAAVAADSIWYPLGRRKGNKILQRLWKISLEAATSLRRADTCVSKQG